MLKRNLLAALLLVVATAAHAQGTESFTSQPSANNGQNGIMFELTALTPLTIYRLGQGGYTTTTVTDVTVWYRQGGINSTTGAWTSAGTSQAYSANATAPFAQIPINLNLQLAANEIYAFAIISTSSQTIGYTTNTASTPHYVGTHLSINAQNSSGGAYSAAATPPMTPSFTPRGFVGTVWYDTGPTLSVDATVGARAVVAADDQGPGNDGVEAGVFTIESNAILTSTLLSIDVEATGTGDPATDISYAAIYRDDDASGDFDSTLDVKLDEIMAWPASGMATFSITGTIEQTFGANDLRTYFIVVKMSGTGAGTSTYDFTIDDLGVGTGTNKAGLPSAVIEGVEIEPPEFVFIDHSPAQQIVFIGSTDVVVQAFEINYPKLQDQPLTGLTLRAIGSGNDVDHVVDVRLVLDVNADGLFDAGDVVIDSGVFSDNDGTIDFDLTSQPTFVAPETRRYLVVYDFNTVPPDGAEFRCFVDDAIATVPGTLLPGLPLPDSNGAAGVVINANLLSVMLDGPNSFATVDSTSSGPTTDGLLLAEIVITTPPSHAWTLTDMTFVAVGTGDSATAFSEVALYQDNGNGTWDGAASDILAAATATAFNAGTNDVTFALFNTPMGANESRRWFLVVKLNGTATAGQTFGARLDSMTTSTGSQHQIDTLPTAESEALVIGDAVLTVARGPDSPTPILRKAGTAAQLVLFQLRLTTINDNVDLNALTLTASGSGDWGSSVDSVSGVQLWLDDGDGVFSAASDTHLAQSGGGASAMLTPVPTLAIGSNSSADLWIVLDLLDTAGSGASAAPHTYTLAVADAANVGQSGAQSVALSTSQPPVSADLSIIDFFVTSFTPDNDALAGGAALTITGSGFIAPVSVTIGGVPCIGSPVIGSGGTQVTGLTVPPGSGGNLPIEISSGNLPPEVISQTFSYKLKVSGDGDSGGDGCTTRTGNNWLIWVALAGMLGIGVLRRRAA